MGDSKNIRVAVRVRPLNRRELEQNQRNIIKVLDHTTLMFDPDEDEDEFFFHGMKQTHRDITKRVKKKLTMEYDDVFDAEANNEAIFETCTKPLVQSVMDGYNCSVFVYGATGAGKTFTMLGSEECRGITFLTMKELFRQIDSLSNARKFDIGISYLEVYNELVMNLLTKSGPLKLREDSSGVVVSGLILKQIHNAEELLDLLALGNQNRTQHPTDANAESSRSHAIFQVHIRMVDKSTGQKRTVKLSMIDLAGSERAASTKGIGIRFKEGANINKSLLALGNCINKLADGLKHIPYRDSNLTRILKDSLGGNCQTLMIANISPSSLTYDDTYNTLKYASRAKKIRTSLKQNIVPTNVPKEFLVKKVNEQAAEIERLKARLKDMEEQKTAAVAAAKSAPAGFTMPSEALLNTWRSRIDQCYATVRKAQEHYFNLQSKEKILNLRSKLKAQVESIKKIVTLDGKHLNADIARLEASIDRYNKQVTRQKDEMNRWAKRYKDAIKSLEALREEIRASDLATLLGFYVRAKDYEIDANKSNYKKNHVMKINMIYTDENKQLEKIMALSAEIVQQDYLLLRSMGRLDNVTLEKMEQMARLDIYTRGVRFTDDDDHNELMKEVNITDTSFDEITNLSDCADFPAPSDMEADCGVKRLNDEDESESENERKKAKEDHNKQLEFKRPKALRPLNLQPKSLSVKSTVSRKTPTKTQKTTTITQFKVPKLIVSNPPKPSSAKKRQKVANSSTSSNDTSDTSDGPDENGGIGNSTFCIDGDKDATSSLFSNVLVGSNVDPHVLKKVLRRASMKGNVISKVTLTLNKENRKFSPKRVGKSPRPLLRTNSSRPHTSAASVINRYRMMKAGSAAGASSSSAVPGNSGDGKSNTYDSDSDRKIRNIRK
nr:kinesin-like protein KIF18A isoform X1 [Aedes albopictus]